MNFNTVPQNDVFYDASLRYGVIVQMDTYSVKRKEFYRHCVCVQMAQLGVYLLSNTDSALISQCCYTSDERKC